MVSVGDGDREEDVEEGEVDNGACTTVAMGSGYYAGRGQEQVCYEKGEGA
jgi:hypothetical protein